MPAAPADAALRSDLPPALALEAVSHRFGAVLAVDDLSLDLEPGELVCLLGPSGCGKTTALRLAAGLEELQQGRIAMDGHAVAEPGRGVPPENRSVGLVFQDYALFPHLSVGDNVAFGLRHLAARDRQAAIGRTLKQVGLAGFEDSYPHELSGGQQQRVALARALAPQPRVMLLDEPFSGLDQRLRHDVRDETLHVLEAAGTATLMVTHDPEEAMFMADRIALMDQGRLIQVGAPDRLYFHPVNAFAAEFFGEINRLPGRVEAERVLTPLGPLPAEGLRDGQPVEVLVRPEAIRLLPPGETAGPGYAGAQVIAARLLGRTSLVHLSVEQAEGAPLHLHARIPGRFLPANEDAFSLDLDPALAFVFPLAEAT
ncbi:ABC transporter ATP-binding protein [Algihabitans albus]|uniref:ABC transporter ATP-binding protein n=1 Tax=Algihabitans albus TaxID=2164067 RepID=UPI000E5C8676|nr:ABC transporter ATP-binding protein [Algihabitans albus]